MISGSIVSFAIPILPSIELTAENSIIPHDDGACAPSCFTEFEYVINKIITIYSWLFATRIIASRSGTVALTIQKIRETYQQIQKNKNAFSKNCFSHWI